MYFNVFGFILMYFDVFECIWMYLNLFESILMDLNLFVCIWIDLELVHIIYQGFTDTYVLLLLLFNPTLSIEHTHTHDRERESVYVCVRERRCGSVMYEKGKRFILFILLLIFIDKTLLTELGVSPIKICFFST